MEQVLGERPQSRHTFGTRDVHRRPAVCLAGRDETDLTIDA
jgi:hypothetical protein